MSVAACADACPARTTPAGAPIGLDRSVVLLTTYGSITRLDEVPAYLARIRRGRPPSPALVADMVARYRAIGGASPLAERTERQRASLQAELARRGVPVRVAIGLRYAPPFIGDVVADLAASGVSRLVGLPLAPHFSRASTCTTCAQLTAAGRTHNVEVELVRDWHTEPQLIVAWADALVATLARSVLESTTPVLFTAHSLPLRSLGGDDHPRRVRETAALVAATAGVPDAAWSVAFQSAGRTDEAWLGPPLRERLADLAAAGARSVVVVPIGFVADHLEIWYDLDIEAAGWAAELGLRLYRVPMPNHARPFIAALADVAVRQLARARA